jgi:hypothetical protein
MILLRVVVRKFNIHNREINDNYHHGYDNVISKVSIARPYVRSSALVVINHRDGLLQWHFRKGVGV